MSIGTRFLKNDLTIFSVAHVLCIVSKSCRTRYSVSAFRLIDQNVRISVTRDMLLCAPAFQNRLIPWGLEIGSEVC